MEKFYNINKKWILALENEEYEFNDILCLLMDMFDKNEPFFTLNDFYNKIHLSHNFFDLLTNYEKCFDFLTRDYNYSPFNKKYF